MREFLAVEVFHTLLQATVMAEDYRQHVNQCRPHSSLRYLTPEEFAPQRTNTTPGSQRAWLLLN
ncbi:MAG: integrase core domain-containing protein [Actinomycetales bacterium]|nr:integrase core domain-containing protein [Actinomycetales bacterium]